MQVRVFAGRSSSRRATIESLGTYKEVEAGIAHGKSCLTWQCALRAARMNGGR